MKISSLALFSFLVVTPASHAAQHRIDRSLAQCINTNSATAGMVNCTNQAASLWDKELNSKYTILMSGLDQGSKDALRNFQRQWIAFRDAELKVMDAMYKGMNGSMYLPMRAADRLEIVKARVLQLESYINLMNDEQRRNIQQFLQ